MAEGQPAGGSIQLAGLIDEYGEQIYRDLHQYAGGLNLVDALREGSGYSPRQILTLIKGLPLESDTAAAMRGGDDFRGWGADRYLTTSLIDAVRENTYATIVMASGKKKPKAPEPTYRPKDKPVPTNKEPNPRNPFFQRLQAAKKARDRTASNRSN